MTEDQREWLHWAILLLIVCLAAYVVQRLTGPVIDWIDACVLEILRFLRASSRLETWYLRLSGFVSIALKFLAAGFVYCWLWEEEWKKSAVIAFLVVTALGALPLARDYGAELVRALLRAPLFYANTAVACAAAFGGARLAEEHRHHPKLTAFREFMSSMFGR